MGRKGKIEIAMVEKRVYAFLKERPDSQAKMAVCQRYLEKLYKSRDSVKKKEYKAQLSNILEVLVRDSTDKLELQAKLDSEREELASQISKRVELRDTVITLERKLTALTEIEARFQQERELKYRAEESMGEQLTENTKLKHMIQQLKKKNSTLEAKLAQNADECSL